MILSCKTGSVSIEETFDSLSGVLGSRGIRGVMSVLSDYKSNVLTFDEAINTYLELPVLSVPDEGIEDSTDDDVLEEYKEQKEAYDLNQGEVLSSATSVKQLRDIVRKHICKDVIFLSDNKEIFMTPNFVKFDSDSVLSQSANICLKLLDILQKDEYTIRQTVEWWITYRTVVYETIQRSRGTFIKNIRDGFAERFHQWNEDGDLYPHFTALLELCDDCEEGNIGESILDLNVPKDVFKEFTDLAFTKTKPKEQFRRYMRMNHFSSVVTPTEEAFAILVLENNYNRWKWTLSKDSATQLHRIASRPPPLYQLNVLPNEGSIKLLAGDWTDIGLERMNQLLEKVEEVRTLRTGWYQETLSSKRRKRDAKRKVKVHDRFF